MFVGSATQVRASPAPMPLEKAAGHSAPFMAEAAAQAELGVVVDVLVADTAHGHVKSLLDLVRRLKSDSALI